MTTLVRWNPARELLSMRSEMDRLMESFFDAPAATMSANFGLAVDATENDKAYIISASVPGVKPEDVELLLEDGILTIKGETNNVTEKSDNDENGQIRYHIRERRSGRFERRLRLPKDVAIDDISAHQDNGVLTITLPKNEQVLPKKITVN